MSGDHQTTVYPVPLSSDSAFHHFSLLFFRFWHHSVSVSSLDQPLHHWTPSSSSFSLQVACNPVPVTLILSDTHDDIVLGIDTLSLADAVCNEVPRQHGYFALCSLLHNVYKIWSLCLVANDCSQLQGAQAREGMVLLCW